MVKASEYVKLEIPDILHYIKNQIFDHVNDPKGIQGNINQLSAEEQDKISNRADRDYKKSLEARELEDKYLYKLSIEKWGEIFGSNFPTYT